MHSRRADDSGLLRRGRRSRRERELEAALARHAPRVRLFECALDMLCVADFSGRFTMMNPACRRVLGWSEEEMVARPFIELVHPDDRSATEAAMSGLREGQTILFFENRYRCRDGSYRILAWTSIPDRVEGLIYAIARDVTAVRQTEDQLEQSREDYRHLFEGMLDGFSYHDMIFDERGEPVDYRFLAVNPAFEAMTGLKAQDLVGRRVLEVLPMTERHWIESFGHVAKTGQPLHFENYSVEFDKHFECLAFRPKPGQFACTFHDITPRKRAEDERRALEQQVLVTQKLESLGLLAGGIAHDFNNLLCALLTSAELATETLAPGHDAHPHMQTIVEASERLSELCRQLLAYAGRSRVVVEPVALSALVQSMGQLLEVSISKKARIVWNLAPDLPLVEADATQIRQIVLNLIINASDAIGDRDGTIRLTTGVLACDQRFLATRYGGAEMSPGDYAYVEVSDTGSGMAPVTLARVFEPFFTTKRTGRGLGLSATLGIVRGHRGTMQVESELGKGSTFRVLLPVVTSAVAPKSTRSASRGRTRSGLALLADDEEIVRRSGRRILEHMGFRVLEAKDGQEAVEHYERFADEIAIVLLDLSMPRLSGTEALERIRALRAAAPVILLSGYGEEEALRRVGSDVRSQFVPKPFREANLEDAIAAVLDV